MHRTLTYDTVDKIGQKVLLFGWVNSVRGHGKIAFIDLRDASGMIQMVDATGKLDLNNEDVVKVVGVVKKRPEKMVNPKIATGTVELDIQKVEIISRSLEPPFPLDSDGYEINEESRCKYRYLDIRRPRLLQNLRLRSKVTTFIRNFLTDRNFIEVETPILTKTTPEGARDFIVPSRLQKGKFYALPQSPQQYKQLLMVAGLERYFQIVRCFRDEDLRADRQFEHTQVDIEMAFIEREDIMKLIEDMYKSIAKSLGKKILEDPFPTFTYEEAMKIIKTISEIMLK